MAEVSERPARSSFVFFCPISVRWGDMDALGHVNNAAYCTYLESARIGYFEGRGVRIPGEGVPVVVSQTLNYREQLRYPAALEIGVRCAGVRHRSFTLQYGIYRQGEDRLVGDGKTVLAWVDATLGRAVALPEDLRERLTHDHRDRSDAERAEADLP